MSVCPLIDDARLLIICVGLREALAERSLSRQPARRAAQSLTAIHEPCQTLIDR